MYSKTLNALSGVVACGLLSACFSGCASFIGQLDGQRFVPEDQLTQRAPASEPAAADDGPAVSTESSVAVRPEFDFANDVAASELQRAAATPADAEPAGLSSADFEATGDDSEAAVSEEEPTVNPFAEMAEQGLIQTSFNTPSTTPGSLPGSTFREAEPRLPSPNADDAAAFIAATDAAVQAYPEEYIFDGGDRDHPVHYYGGSMQGLDTEDTVAEFKDHEGRNHVKASNRVAVYAPRFGAVRTISGPGIDVKVDKAAGATDIAGLGKLHANRQLHGNTHQSRLGGLGARSGASGMETAQPIHSAEQANGVVQNEKVDKGLEARTSIGMGLLQASDMYELKLVIQGPGKSTTATAFGRAQASTQATQTYSTFRVQSVLGMDKGGRPGQVHITKTASPLVAKAGDIITFMIQFRNTGDLNVEDVRIIDNLTPRLTYIEGTGQIDIGNEAGGGLTLIPNKEGSDTLIFELDEPLQGGQVGTITFQAKVL